MPYVDGYIIAIPKRKVDAYRKMALKAGKVWKDHGALEFRECIGDDLKSKTTGAFRRGLKLTARDTVAFSWVVYKSRAHRDRVNAKVMKDPRLEKMMKEPMPFDMKRMAYGGFRTIVDL